MIHKKEFVLNFHYYKPKPKIILFKWSVIEKWLEGGTPDLNESIITPTGQIEYRPPLSNKEKFISSIKI
jgi:hypothetical protein